MTRAYAPWTDEELARLKSLDAAGERTGSIAQKLGRSKRSVWLKLRQFKRRRCWMEDAAQSGEGRMRFAWTSEPFGYALRDGNGNARATMVRNHEGFWAQIITRDMPDSGPYQSRIEGATWVARMLVHLELVPADSAFGEVPIIPAGKRAA